MTCIKISPVNMRSGVLTDHGRAAGLKSVLSADNLNY